MRRVLAYVLAWALLGLGCATGHAAPAGKPIVVGSILDQTGPLNIYGIPMVDATRLAIESINRSGGVLGRPLKLIEYDAQSDNSKYTMYANELALRDHVAVIMGGITSASREAIRPVADRDRTLYFYNEQYEGGVCDKNVFLTGIVPTQQIPPLVDWAVKHAGKTFYILAADYNYGHISAQWVDRYVAKDHGKVLGTQFIPLNVSDFGTVITRLEQARPAVVVSLLVGGDQMAFYRQFAAAGLAKHMRIISPTFGLGNEQVVLAPSEAKGIVVAYPYFEEIDSPANRAFRKLWVAHYGKSVSITDSAVTVWNGWHLWAEAVAKAGTTQRVKVIAALESGLSFDGPSGKVSIDAPTHGVIQNVRLGEVDSHHGFRLIAEHKAVAPAFEQRVCNLLKHPGLNRQFTPADSSK